MAERIELFEVTVPLGTVTTLPFTQSLSMFPGITERIEIVFPSGLVGLVGLRVLHSAQVIIPHKGLNWLITDNEKISWPVAGYPTGDKWSVEAFNEDLYDHTIYLRWHLNEIPTRALGALIPLVIE